MRLGCVVVGTHNRLSSVPGQLSGFLLLVRARRQVLSMVTYRERSLIVGNPVL